MSSPLVYLHPRQAVRERRAPPAYRLACQFFGCFLVDRAERLDCGIDIHVLDPLSRVEDAGSDFAGLCDVRGQEIVHAARESNRQIQVMWSGGIDSTCALIAALKAAAEADCAEQVEVVLSAHSIEEYPLFWSRYLEGGSVRTIVTDEPQAALDPDGAIIVTGEHGDQLFGSDKLKPYIDTGDAFRGFEELIWWVVGRRIGRLDEADDVIDFLMPQIEAASVPIRTLYDCLWWINFSMKWQHVTLRLVAGANDPQRVYGAIDHFFRDVRFEGWALHAAEEKIRSSWLSYKHVAKQYVFDYTGDAIYRDTKLKEQSLRKLRTPSRLPRWMRPSPRKALRASDILASG